MQLQVDILGNEVRFHHYRGKNVDWVFVDHVSYKRPGGLYGDAFGTYGDNQVLRAKFVESLHWASGHAGEG